MLKFEATRDDDEDDFTCTFTYETEFMKFQFSVPNPLDLSIEKFHALANGEFHRKGDGLTLQYFNFYDLHDGQYITITLRKDAVVGDIPAAVWVEFRVEFTVAEQAADSTLKLPFHVCQDALQEAAVWRATQK